MKYYINATILLKKGKIPFLQILTPKIRRIPPAEIKKDIAPISLVSVT